MKIKINSAGLTSLSEEEKSNFRIQLEELINNTLIQPIDERNLVVNLGNKKYYINLYKLFLATASLALPLVKEGSNSLLIGLSIVVATRSLDDTFAELSKDEAAICELFYKLLHENYKAEINLNYINEEVIKLTGYRQNIEDRIKACIKSMDSRGIIEHHPERNTISLNNMILF